MDADELRDACRAAAAHQEATGAALAAVLPPAHRPLLDPYADACRRRHAREQDRLVFELRRHLPHLAVVLRTLEDHVGDLTYDDLGRCCRD